LFSPQIPSGPSEAPSSTAAAPAAGASSTNSGAAPGLSAQPLAGAADAAQDAGARVMLQVGAFHSADDADAVRARLALLGLDAKVFAASVDGATVYRVRMGPYVQLDDLNGIRRTLSDNGMEPQIVHMR